MPRAAAERSAAALLRNRGRPERARIPPDPSGRPAEPSRRRHLSGTGFRARGGRLQPSMTQVTLAEEGLDSLFGTQDENLRRIERTFDVTVNARGNELSIQGDPERAAAVERLLNDLASIYERGYRFRPGDVQ